VLAFTIDLRRRSKFRVDLHVNVLTRILKRRTVRVWTRAVESMKTVVGDNDNRAIA